MLQRRSAIQIEINQQTFLLNASGSIYWRQHNTLMVADLHLGRETVLQKSGIAMPSGATAETLQKLSDDVKRHGAGKLIILGDLIHARSGLTVENIESIKQSFQSLLPLEILLIEGNHDRGCRQWLEELPIQVVKPPMQQQGFWFLHDLESEYLDIPTDQEATKTNDGCPVVGDSIPHITSQQSAVPAFAFAGHLHPAIQFASIRDTLKCFYQKKLGLILPAYGQITGSKKIKPNRDEPVYITTGQAVYRFDMT